MIKRLPIIRYIRWWILSIQLAEHVQMRQCLGIGFHPSQNDLDFLDKVWKGEL